MKVLIACEYSGRVRDAFRALGHAAWSCDLEPTESPSPHHIQGSVLKVLKYGWDLMIGHPPCTYLCNSGVCHLHTDPTRWAKLDDGVAFFRALWNAPVARICLENPTPHKYATERLPCKYTQAIQPYEYGHTQSKRTCLWLKGLAPLQPTNNVHAEMMKLPLKERQPLWWGGSRASKDRSRTFLGIAQAMAEQWGKAA